MTTVVFPQTGAGAAEALTKVPKKLKPPKERHPQRYREGPAPGEIVSHEGGYVFEVSAVGRIIRFVCVGISETLYMTEDESLKEIMDVLLNTCKNDVESFHALLAIQRADKERSIFKPKSAMTAVAVFARLGATVRVRRMGWIVALGLIRTLDHWAIFLNAYNRLGMVAPSKQIVNEKEKFGRGGWGRMARAAVASWFEQRDAKTLAYSFTKYQSRSGVTGEPWKWTDILRLGHPKPTTDAHRLVFEYVRARDYPKSEGAVFVFPPARKVGTDSLDSNWEMVDVDALDEIDEVDDT